MDKPTHITALPSSPTRRWVLVSIDDPRTCIFVHDGFLVGRMHHCNVRLRGEGVSRHHAMFYVQGGHLEVVDLDSRNGTTVNGSRIRRHYLGVNDVVSFDDETFAVEQRPAWMDPSVREHAIIRHTPRPA